MKLTFFFIVFVFVPFVLLASEQPPYEVDDPAISENFRNIYLTMDQHKHNNDDSSRLNDVIPSSGSTYSLGSTSSSWKNVYSDSGTYSGISIGTGTASKLNVATITVTTLNIATATVNGNSLFISSFSAYNGYNILFGSGSIAANTTITIIDSRFSVLGIPVVSELEDVNTAATSVRVKTCCDSSNSFGIYNSDVVNAKRYTFMVPAHR